MVTSSCPAFFTVTAVWIFSPFMIIPNFHSGGEKTTVGLPAEGKAPAQMRRRAERYLADDVTVLPGTTIFFRAPPDESRQEEQVEDEYREEHRALAEDHGADLQDLGARGDQGRSGQHEQEEREEGEKLSEPEKSDHLAISLREE